MISSNPYIILSKSAMKTTFFLLPYFLMIISGLMLPSDGNHGLMTPKSLAFLGSTYLALMYFIIRQKASLYQLRTLLSMFIMVSFLLIWLFLGAVTDLENWTGAFDQFKIFVITLSFIIITLYWISEGILTTQKFMRTVILSNFIYSLSKLFLVLLHMLHIVNMWSVTERLGIRFMSMEMAGGLSRFQTSVDIVTPFLIFFVLQSDRLQLGFSKRFRLFYCLISTISILFSFSRFLMGVALMSAILYWITLNHKAIARALALCFITAFCFVIVIGPETVAEIIYKRFFSVDNYLSDLTRVQQIDALMGHYETAPYFGQGLGGYVKNFIRDGGLTYSYEVQWVSFLMQFGLVGLTLLLIPVGFISAPFILRSSFSRIHWAFFGLFLIWLLSGFTNPFLISLSSGIIYSMFLTAAAALENNLAYVER